MQSFSALWPHSFLDSQLIFSIIKNTEADNSMSEDLRGGVRFPTGGKSPRMGPQGSLIRCNSGTDS